jgi:hypothetical protein
MIQEILERCHAKPFGASSPNLESALDSIGRDYVLTATHREVLSFFHGAPISFESCAKVRSDLYGRQNDGDDLLVSFLFGVGGGEDTIERMSHYYADILPTHLLPFASSPWDDLYCIDPNGIVYFWDHKNPEESLSIPVSNSFDDFFSAFELVADDYDGPSEAIDSESWIDPDI